ncbi:hypothetical protein EDC01DRAFT_654731 [Geopyxis carbonaria]|nr:hypothetical protein EDC01DRAFT_654731 [Geopyxis carbonaria]
MKKKKLCKAGLPRPFFSNSDLLIPYNSNMSPRYSRSCTYSPSQDTSYSEEEETSTVRTYGIYARGISYEVLQRYICSILRDPGAYALKAEQMNGEDYYLYKAVLPFTESQVRDLQAFSAEEQEEYSFCSKSVGSSPTPSSSPSTIYSSSTKTVCSSSTARRIDPRKINVTPIAAVQTCRNGTS